MSETAYDRIYAVVRRIPKGRVATYGQVAEVAGLEGRARMVGYALSRLPSGNRLPWHRVINAEGRVSRRSTEIAEEDQRQLLEAEGVQLDRHGTVDLGRYRWRPRGVASRYGGKRPSSLASRASGTGTMPVFGSIVQKG